MLQCVYYILVIVAVVLQIDALYPRSSMVLFGVIAGMSIMFLLLELSQVLHNPRRYAK